MPQARRKKARKDIPFLTPRDNAARRPHSGKNTKRPKLPIAAIVASFALIASFWLTWVTAFNQPVSGPDLARMLSYLSKGGNPWGLSPFAVAAPFVVLLLGFLGIIWGCLAYERKARLARGILLASVIILSGALVFFGTWLLSIMLFPSALGLGFWLAYISSAVLLCIALASAISKLSPCLKTPLDFCLYAAVRLFALGFWLFPRKAAIKLGESLAAAVLAFLPKRRKIAMRNLKLVFGDELDEAQKKAIVRKSFLNLGRQAAELCHLPELIARPAEELFTYENLGAVEQATAGGRGLIILTGHFGCWELSQLAMTKAGFPMTALARPLDNRFLDRWINRMRTMAGSTIIARKHSVRRIVSELKAGKIVAILFDQNVHRKECVFAELVGKNVASSPLPAALHRMTGADVIFGAGIPCPDGRYKLVLSNPIPAKQCDSYEEFVTINTSAYNAVFERFIRQYPEAWLWVHNRFKDTQKSPGLWAKRLAKRA